MWCEVGKSGFCSHLITKRKASQSEAHKAGERAEIFGDLEDIAAQLN